MKTKSAVKEKDTARDQAAAQLESIKEMVAQLKWAQDDTHDGWNTDSEENARRTIEEDALSVEVRSGWHEAGAERRNISEEFTILLCTGGPAVRIIGGLDNGEPETARIEYQDWGTPWTEYRLTSDEEETVLAYCRCFYFGE